MATLNGSKEDFVQMTREEVNDSLDLIIKNQIPLRRKRKDGTFGFIQPKDFDLYLKNREMDFFIDRESLGKIRQELQEKNNSRGKTETPENIIARINSEHEKAEADEIFKNRLEKANRMDIIERIQSVLQYNHRMKEMIAEGLTFEPKVIKETGNIFADTLCINKATLEENLNFKVPQGNMHSLATGTRELVNNFVTLLARGKATFHDLASLEHIDTGSNTLNHMNRMLIRFISFLFFYNGYFQKYSNEIKKLRAHFSKKFLPYYNKVLKRVQHVNLEIVFKGGISPIRERHVFLEYCMGGFMHDIGKLHNIKYYDGQEAYDIRKVSKHVFDGYNMLLESRQFSIGTISTGLLHHDYYGAPFGYKQLNTFQNKFKDKRENQREPIKYFISYNIHDVCYGTALSYFPNKMIEILDVFDAMTDSEKKYKKKIFSSEQAAMEMRDVFLEKDHLGLDPILFNIFLDFLVASKIIPNRAVIERIKI